MNILLTGGTGLIGSRIITHLHAEGHSLVALTRRMGQTFPISQSILESKRFRAALWDAKTLNSSWSNEVSSADVIIHLAGEGIFDARWTEDVKKRLVESRITTTRLLTEAIAAHATKPRMMISASAVGYYGDRKDIPTDESAPQAKGNFLANLCGEWEAASREAGKYGVRVANPRIGIVLSETGGALGRMIPIFKAFLGMPLGSGKQWFPWVHIDDVVRGICFPLEEERLQGAYNLASPEPVRMEEFCAALGKALSRPSWSPLTVPEFVLRLGLGEAASSLTGGQRIIPKKLLDLKFEFRYTEISSALRSLVG